MFVPIPDVPAVVVSDDRQQSFMSLLPKLESRAKTAFASISCPHDRADAVTEVVALAWEQFRRTPTAQPLSADDFITEIVTDARLYCGCDSFPSRSVRT